MSNTSNQPEMFADGEWFRMSNLIIDKIPEIGTTAASAYMVLARFADDEGVCFPSTAKIAAMLGMTPRAARLSIARLEEAGLITVERRPQMAQKNLSNLFRLLPLSPQGQAERYFRSPQLGRNESSPTGGTRVQGVGEREFTLKKTYSKKTHLKKTSRALRFDANDMKFFETMWERISTLAPNQKKPNLEEWAHDIRITRENDGRTIEDLAAVFIWANEHEWWRTRTRSPKALRRQYDSINTQRLDKGATNGKPKQDTGPGRQFDPSAKVAW